MMATSKTGKKPKLKSLAITFAWMAIFVMMSAFIWRGIDELSESSVNDYILSEKNLARDVYEKASKLSFEERVTQLSEGELSRVMVTIKNVELVKNIVNYIGCAIQVIVTIFFSIFISLSLTRKEK